MAWPVAGRLPADAAPDARPCANEIDAVARELAGPFTDTRRAGPAAASPDWTVSRYAVLGLKDLFLDFAGRRVAGGFTTPDACTLCAGGAVYGPR